MPKTAAMPLDPAYEFAKAHGLALEARVIKKQTPMCRHFDRGRQIRKALLLDLFEKHGLLEPFVAECWPLGATEAGRVKRASYSRDRDANQRCLDGEPITTEEQRDCIIALLEEDTLSRDEIAAKAGVSPGVVNVINAQLDEEAGGDDVEDGSRFGPERDLQLALRANIEQLESGLEIIDGGRERITAAGRLDITARDRDGTIVVIELKADEARPEALTQVLAYMATVADEEKKPVRGMLVAGGFHSRVQFAVRAVPNVQLRQYRYKFTFDAVS